jgi:serine/threonine-protein kinase
MGVVIDVGEQLAGYRIEAVAGQGVAGTVYEATDLSLQRRVALKVAPATGELAGYEARARVRHAALQASALGHEHVIPVFDAGDAGAWMFVAMLLVDGATLSERIDDGDLTVREYLRVLRAIAAALDAAHEAGLVHGDVKPSNILLTAAGHPYLTDFGMPADAYAAPEQLEGRPATAASDVYALTAVLAECLGDATPELGEIVVRGMADRPSERYRTAGELVAASDAALAGLPDATLDRAVPRAPAGSFAKAARRRPRADAPQPVAPSAPRPAPARADADAQTAAPTPAPARRKPYVPPLPTPEEEAAAKLARSRRPLAATALARRAGRPLAAVLAVAALLAPVLLGYALGGEDARPAPKARPAASDSVRLTVAPGWHAAKVQLPGLELVAPIGLRHAGGVELAAGRLRDPAAGLDPTRERLRAAIGQPRKDVVWVGGHRALGYAGRTPAGRSVWLALLPDSSGWTVVACLARASAALDQLCGRLAATLKPVNATPAQLGPEESLGDTLRGTLAALRKARGAARQRLRARSARTRGRAEATLADATARAARELDDADAGTRDKPLVGALAAALKHEAVVLKRLASAARRNDRPAYRRRRNALRRAEQATVQALRALRRGGYDATVKRP